MTRLAALRTVWIYGFMILPPRPKPESGARNVE